MQQHLSKELKDDELKYLQALAKQFPTIPAAATEITNLRAILSLPKGTEHFITDVHGEYEQFSHVMRNGSGAIRRKIDEEFGPVFRTQEKDAIAALIYYPRQRIEYIRSCEENMEEWYSITIFQLVQVCRAAASKYTRSKVRKSMPPEFAYVIEELMTGRPDEKDQEAYYQEIIHSVVETARAEELIIALCDLIRRLIIDHLHVIGDIFDRGPYPHMIMDELMRYHSVDIQWGNHDIVWMGAAAGSGACLANVLRISARYGNLDILEDGYGINLVPLATFALNTYKDDPCTCFSVNYRPEDSDIRDASLDEKIHKAITVIQFKLEGQLIRRNPGFQMDNRLFLDKIDPEKGTVLIDGNEYAMKDMHFPTIDWNDPYALSDEEKDVVFKLKRAFEHSEKLQRHVRFLYAKGGLYKAFNGNLLYHGCVPLNAEGSLKEVDVFGKKYSGKALYDALEAYARKGYFAVDLEEKHHGEDMLLYLWENQDSPVFGKEKMATFERYFVAEKETHKEPKNPYYALLEDEAVVNRILENFGLDTETSHIVNGHVPVEAKKGESPMKCGGKLLIIDGGFSKAYQPTTGIAGYTLIFNSYGMILAAHEPFSSIEKAVSEGRDIVSHRMVVEENTTRITVGDTDNGKRMKEEICDLEKLLAAYRSGVIAEVK